MWTSGPASSIRHLYLYITSHISPAFDHRLSTVYRISANAPKNAARAQRSHTLLTQSAADTWRPQNAASTASRPRPSSSAKSWYSGCVRKTLIGWPDEWRQLHPLSPLPLRSECTSRRCPTQGSTCRMDPDDHQWPKSTQRETTGSHGLEQSTPSVELLV